VGRLQRREYVVILTIDVGNTEIACGLFDGDRLGSAWRLSTRPERTADELALSLDGLLSLMDASRTDVHGVAIGSVVPRLTGPLAEACAALFAADPVVVDAATPLPVRLEVDAPETVGADRILNTLAVFERFARDAIVVDLGTATTFDCVTADGAFIGGVIAPGVRTAAEALLSRAARLARFEDGPPDRVIGTNTEACLRSGIYWGAVDTIDGMVERIRREWERPAALVLATGGLATQFGPVSRAIELVEPWLTLDGLRRAYRHVRG
jgi:type III pantothenate kinase